MKKIPKAGEYVVLNSNPDATIYLVTNACGLLVDLIDSGLNPAHKQHPYTCAYSLVEYPSKLQLENTK